MTFSAFDAAVDSPGETALVAGTETLTYADIAERAARVAGFLREKGLSSREARVAVVPSLDLASIIVVHALVASGIPMVLVHPRLNAAERRWIVDDSGTSFTVDAPAAQLPEMLAAEAWRGPATPPAPASTLAILYTSGTTGHPKGAVLSRRAFEAAARASEHNLGWQRGDRWLLCMPPAHVGGLSIILRALLARRCVVLPDVPGPFDPEATHATLERREVTLVSLVPTMLMRMFDHPRSTTLPPRVRAVLLGGAAAPSTLVDEAAARRAPVLTTYGLTEACSQVTTQRYGTKPAPEQGSGEPVLGMHVRVADDGRIEVSGDALMSGYLTHPSPLLEDGYLRTDDFGRLDEHGRLHVLGRRQELVVTGGENVYPAEVERVIERLSGVRACCVFGVPDPTWGEIVSVAIMRAPGSTEPSAAALETFASEMLASHKRPRRIAFVDELPVGPTGKLDRHAAAALATPLLTRLGGR